MNNKEQKRLLVLNEVLAGRMTGQEAAEMPGVTLRHTRRLIAAYRKSAVAGPAHGNRGRSPANKLEETVAEEMDHYEVRNWSGWHHHMTMCLFAHHFLVRTQHRLKRTPQL